MTESIRGGSGSKVGVPHWVITTGAVVLVLASAPAAMGATTLAWIAFTAGALVVIGGLLVLLDSRLGRVRWWLVGIFVVLGSLTIAAGWSVAYRKTDLRGDEAAYWSGLPVNIGTSLLLAAVLVWFERVLVRHVQKENKSAVTSAANMAATEAVDRAAALIVPRLDEMDSRWRQRREETSHARAATAAGVAASPTFDAVEAAFVAARSINAVYTSSGELETAGDGQVTIPAGDGLDVPRVRVTYTPAIEPDPATITFSLAGDEIVLATWTVDQSVEDVFDKLTQQMIATGRKDAVSSMSMQKLFANLSTLLTDAIVAREPESNGWLSGSAVIEMIADGWVATGAGVEERTHGLLLERDLFGRYGSATNRLLAPRIPDAPPTGIDQATWDAAIERSRRYYTGDPFAGVMQGALHPYERETIPR